MKHLTQGLRGPRNTAGFTIVELILVLGFASLAALAIALI